VKGGIKLWPVGSSAAKKMLYGRINIALPGPGYVHTSSDLDEDFYDQLTAERLITRYVKGFPTQEWFLPNGRRNEALDCAVYALAGAYQLGLPRFKAGDWAKARVRLGASGKTAEARPPEPQPATAALAPVPAAPATPGVPAVMRRPLSVQTALRPRRPNFTNNW
jgi:phage terminase large subunit GpA-like protein